MYKSLRVRPKSPVKSEESTAAEQPLPRMDNITHARKILKVAQEQPDHPMSRRIMEHVADHYPHLVGDGPDREQVARDAEMETIRRQLAGDVAPGDGANVQTAEQAEEQAEGESQINEQGRKVKSRDLPPVVS